MTLDELTEFVTENGFPKFRAKQIYDWLYKNVTDFDNMRNIPADLKAFLKSSSYISVANIEKKLVSRYDKTVKYLFSFNDGECVESVTSTDIQSVPQHRLAVKWVVHFVQQAKAVFHGALHRRKCSDRLRPHSVTLT